MERTRLQNKAFYSEKKKEKTATSPVLFLYL
jgi:hypothetical protein